MPKRVFVMMAAMALGFQPCDAGTAIPVRFDHNLPFVECAVEGHTFTALIDTGSFRSIQISSTVAATLGLHLADSSAQSNRYATSRKAIRSGAVHAFAVGATELHDVAVDVIDGDIESIARQIGTPFDVILGWGFLGERSFRLDYEAKELDLAPDAVPAGPRVALKYEVVNRVPIVQSTVGDGTVKWLIDTGAPVCNLDPSLQPEGAIAASFDGSRLDMQCRIKDLAALRGPTGAQGVLGNNVLAQYVIFSDAAAHTVYLLRRR